MKWGRAMDDLGGLDARLASALERISAAHGRERESLRMGRAQDGAAGELQAVKADLEATRSALEAARAEVEALRSERDEAKARLQTVTAQAEADAAARRTAEEALAAHTARERLERVKDGNLAEGLTGRVTVLETALDRVKAVNAQLRANNAALREAAVAGQADGAALDESLKAEIEALSAAREADRAEMDAIMAALKPIIEETANA